MIVPRNQIEKALSAKGFRLKESHHRFYYFYYENKITSIRTKVSRGSSHKDYNDILLKQIQHQLKFDTKEQLFQFLQCPLKEEDYVQLLKEKGLI